MSESNILLQRGFTVNLEKRVVVHPIAKFTPRVSNYSGEVVPLPN